MTDPDAPDAKDEPDAQLEADRKFERDPEGLDVGPGDRAFDLDDLERDGVAGVVARLQASRGPDAGDEPESITPRWRTGRTPILSIVVIGLAIGLLVLMWPDFRYALSSREPIDLGHARDVVAADGSLPDDLENRYVVLEGTPDVQNALRLDDGDRYVGYRRLTEGGGRLFAMIPRSKDDKVTNEFEGRFQGRVVRLGDDPIWPHLQAFFEVEKITSTVEATPQALADAASKRAGEGLSVDTAAGLIELGPTERVRLVTRAADARVQLGRESFTTDEAAEQAIAALGYPYFRQEKRPTFHSFVVRIPEAEREAVQRKLNDALVGEPGNADPRKGAIVLPLSATYTTPAADLSFADGKFTFPYGDNTTSPGYRVEDGRLVPAVLSGDTMQIELGELQAVRLEPVLKLDPDGYLVVVGAEPGDFWPLAVGWLLALGLAGINLLALGLWARRRFRAAR